MVLNNAGLCGCFDMDKIKNDVSIKTYFYVYEICHLALGLIINAVLLYFSCKMHMLIKQNADEDLSKQRCRVSVILFSFFFSTMLWALTDLEVQFLAFVDKEETIDATLIVSYILAPSVGSFLTIGILLFLHLSNITSIIGLFRLRSY